MHEQDMDISLKVIIVGNGMVGKTSLINRFARGVTTETYKKTIGTDFMEKEITVRNTGDVVKLMLWDTAGQEMFSKLTRSYYKGSGAVIYVFSTVDRESFLEIEKWKQKVESECGDIASVLVQNKIDLLENALMTKDEVEDLARRMNVRLFRTSVKEGLFVEDIFDYLAEQYLKHGDAQASEEAVPSIQAPPLAVTSVEAEAAGEKKIAATNSSATSTSSSTAAAKGTTSFQLQPLTQRTKGKKQSWCSIL